MRTIGTFTAVCVVMLAAPAMGQVLQDSILAGSLFQNETLDNVSASWDGEFLIRGQGGQSGGGGGGDHSDDWEPAAVSHQEWARQGAWEECEPRFRLSEFNIYPTFSYQGNLSATYTEFEFASHTDLGCIEMENRTVLNVADLPSSISLGPTNPSAADTVDVRASGFGDVLSGFFFSRKDTRHKWHLGIGPVFTFPSATDEILGSGNWTVGPGAHFSTEMGNLTAGFFLWQSWTFAQDPSRKPVNQLFGKPFFIYDVNKKWDLVYIPLGLSMSWDAPSGEQWTVPLGGGVRRLFKLCDQQMGFQVQVFDYVAQKKSDPDWELRMTIEFLFDE